MAILTSSFFAMTHVLPAADLSPPLTRSMTDMAAPPALGARTAERSAAMSARPVPGRAVTSITA
jgi:hypothetical protein